MYSLHTLHMTCVCKKCIYWQRFCCQI